MSRSIWKNVRGFNEDTLLSAKKAALVVIKDGSDFNLALMFAGYYCERIQQNGRGGMNPERMYKASRKRRFIFSRSGMEENYLLAGCLLLGQIVGLDRGAPPNMIMDKFMEEHGSKS